MGYLTNILVVTLLYLQCINCETTFKQQQIYAYKGKVLTKNFASDKHASIWTITGNLIVQDLTDNIIFKLDDIKTRIFNGNPSDLDNAHDKPIPDDSKIIMEPFSIYPTSSGSNITHNPDEPVWSLNMKRSIASIFYIRSDRVNDVTQYERNIYGFCEVKYKVVKDNGLVVWKTINHKSCEHKPTYETSNVVKDPTAKDFETVQMETKRIYHFGDIESLLKVESISYTTYQSMPAIRSKQIIEQNQDFTQISNTTTFEPIDISKLTANSDIIFDYSSDIKGGRDSAIKKKTGSELIDSFNKNYQEFKTYFEKYPLENVDVQNDNDTTTNMYDALENMGKDTLTNLGKKIMKSEDNLLQHLFVSYLPYIGTNDSLRYIKDLLDEDVLNDLLYIKVLATLPDYVVNNNEDLTEELEGLMNLDKVANNQVKYAGILSFASLVKNAYSEGSISETKFTHYAKIYQQHFEDSEDNEVKMTYLLGLINMAPGLKPDFMLSIIINPNESQHIRSLATYGFKDFLISSPEEIYKNMWPIVKNKTEPFEVRVISLDLLLYTDLSADQFNSIVNWYHHELSDPSEQHLGNYFYTSLKALQNSTGYYSYLGAMATETLQTIKPLKYNRAWSTGNYRIAYTDSEANYGASFQARLISNPVTNVVNMGLLTVDSFVHSSNIGRYTAYIKVEGLADMLFSLSLLYDDSASIPKLMELIKTNAYKFKTGDDIHVELVLFNGNQVVFGININKDNVDNYASNPLFLDLLKLLVDYNSLSYPVFYYNYLVSDLGTGIKIASDVTEISSYELENFEKLFDDSSEENVVTEFPLNYRSLWCYSLYAECYNPLAQVSIGTYKAVSEEQRIHIPFLFNDTSDILKWKNVEDSINIVQDHLIGTIVDDADILHEYCPKCEHISELPVGKMGRGRVPEEIEMALGVHFYIKKSFPSDEQLALDQIEPIRSGNLGDILDDHESLSFLPSEGLTLLLQYATYNKFIIKDLYKYSLKTMSYYDDPTETLINFDINEDKDENEDDPISGSGTQFWFAIKTIQQDDSHELSNFNTTYKYTTASKSTTKDVQPHIEHKYEFDIALSTYEKRFKMCIEREVLYPNRRTNKFSLDPIEPTKATTKFGWGTITNITDACPNKDKITLTELYSGTEKQKALMIASNEYKNCKQHSQGLKYIPPTDDCFAAHEIISKYGSCDIYVDLSDSIAPEEVQKLTRGEYGIHFVRYTQINETHSKISISNELLSQFDSKEISKSIRDSIETSESLELMTVNPASIAYYDTKMNWGFESVCYVTTNRVRTFTGNTIKKYYDKSGNESVAFLECMNVTTQGMTIQRYGDKFVGFHAWAMNYTLVARVNDNGAIQFEYNGDVVTENVLTDDDYNIYFLDKDVIYVITPKYDIFYTAEYVSVRINSIYINYLCGLCAEIENH